MDNQDKNKIDEWLNVEFPGITKLAEEENAETLFDIFKLSKIANL